VESLTALRERRGFECRLAPDRALRTIDDAEGFLHDRGLLTRTTDCALPSLYEACHEDPYQPGSPGFGTWPATKWPWFGELAGRGYLATGVHRGKNLYANFCFNCHGKLGLGNGETGKDGKALPGKPLNKADFKYVTLKDDPAKLKQTEDYIRLRVTRGKANVPPQFSMPAWGQSDGGPFNPEQVSQLISFIMHGTDDDWADILTIRSHLEGADTTPDPGPPPAPLSGADVAQQYCTTCHSFDPNKPSTVPSAPNLGRYGIEGPLNDQLKALKASGDPDWLFKWVSNAPKIKPGIIMPVWINTEPGGQLDEASIRLVVQYLQGLGK